MDGAAIITLLCERTAVWMSLISLRERSAFPGCRCRACAAIQLSHCRRRRVCLCVCVCVDRADGWAQGPAHRGAAQTLSQMPPGRTGRSFVRRAGTAGPGSRSLNAVAAMKHHTHARASRFLVCESYRLSGQRRYMYIFTPLDSNVGTFLQDKPLGT